MNNEEKKENNETKKRIKSSIYIQQEKLWGLDLEEPGPFLKKKREKIQQNGRKNSRVPGVNLQKRKKKSA